MKRGELQKLLRVPCTVKQARQIKKRNEIGLGILENWKEGDGDTTVTIGCPHCEDAPHDNGCADCDRCDWSKYPDRSISKNRCYCHNGRFYGIGALSVSGLVYLSYKAHFGWYNAPSQTERQNSINQAKGHITWANAVIRRGGIGKDSKPINSNWNKGVKQ